VLLCEAIYPVNIAGIESAEAKARDFLAAGIMFDSAVTSDLIRAVQTANIFMAHCGGGRCVDVDLRLRECHLGEFEGMLKSDIHGPKYDQLWGRLRSLPHDERVRRGYFDDLESPLTVACRAASAIIDAALAHERREISALPDSASGLHVPNKFAEVEISRHVLCVTHSTVMESVLAALFGAIYESIDMENLACMQISLRRTSTTGAWRLAIDNMHGITFQLSDSSLKAADLISTIDFFRSSEPAEFMQSA
jgi:broad specificity phosphatase PhoE